MLVREAGRKAFSKLTRSDGLFGFLPPLGRPPRQTVHHHRPPHPVARSFVLNSDRYRLCRSFPAGPAQADWRFFLAFLVLAFFDRLFLV
eukprot:24637_5